MLLTARKWRMAYKLTIERGDCKALELLFDGHDGAVEHAVE